MKAHPTLNGIGLAGLGLVGLSLQIFIKTAQLDPLGVVAICAATTAMATGTVLTKKWGQPVHLLVFTAWQLTAGGFFVTPPSIDL